MRHVLAATVAGTVFLVPLTVATTQPAEAAGCTTAVLQSMTITPKTVVLGTQDPKGIDIVAKIKTNGCRIGTVEAGLYGPNFVDTFELEKVETVGGVTAYETGLRLNPGGLENSEAGRWSSWITASGSTIDQAGPGFSIKKAARATTNATPEPARKGTRLTVAGTLTRANWDTLRYVGFTGQKASLQFRTPTGGYRTIKTVTSGKGGALTTTVTASQDGCYRYVFAGTSTTARAVSPGDCVDVR